MYSKYTLSGLLCFKIKISYYILSKNHSYFPSYDVFMFPRNIMYYFMSKQLPNMIWLSLWTPLAKCFHTLIEESEEEANEIVTDNIQNKGFAKHNWDS